MKKIKLFKKKIYEDDNQAAQQQSGATASSEIKYESPNPEVFKAMEATIQNSTKQSVIKEGILFKLKLTKKFSDNIVFPRAAGNLKALLEPANMPRKYQDVHDSIDANPLQTIKNADDLAKKYFASKVVKNDKGDEKIEVDRKLESPKAIDKDGKDIKPEIDDTPVDTGDQNNQQNNGQDQGQGQQQPQTQPGPQNPPVNGQQSGNANASYLYYGDNLLNEALGQAAAIGFTGGSWFSTIVGHFAAGAAGFAAGAAPVGIGAYMLGGVGPKISADHGNFSTDDRDILQGANLKTDNKSQLAKQSDLPERIDSYIVALINGIHQPLVQCTPREASSDIAELLSFVAGLKSRSSEDVQAFLKNNDEHFKKAKERDREDRLARVQEEKDAMSDFNKVLIAAQKAGKTIDSATLKELSGTSNSAYKKRKDFLKELGAVNDSLQLHEKPLSTLNESESGEDVVFDADAIFEDIKQGVYAKMIKIFSHSELPQDVERARKTMEGLRDGATKEILEKIKIVCRTANSDQSGLSGKIASFISKHPMREQFLTNLWKRHETDLDTRIDRRIDHMVSLSGQGPLLMARNFYTETIPNLIAIMVTYKSIVQLYNSKQAIDEVFLSSVTEDEINEQTADKINMYPNILANIFGDLGSKLNKDKKAVYNASEGKFTGEEMTYLFPWVERIMASKIKENNLEHIIKYVNELQQYAADNNISAFFSGLTNIMVESLGGSSLDTIADAFIKTFDEMNQETINDIDNVMAFMSQDHDKIVSGAGDEFVFKETLYNIFAGKGQALKNYAGNSETVRNISQQIASQAGRRSLTEEQIKELQKCLGEEPKEGEIEIAKSWINKNWETMMSGFRACTGNNVSIDNIVEFYYKFGMTKLTAISSMSPYKAVNTLLAFCIEPAIQTRYNEAAGQSELELVRNSFEEAMGHSEDYETYLQIISGAKFKKDSNTQLEQGSKRATSELKLEAILGKKFSPEMYNQFFNECYILKVLDDKDFDKNILAGAKDVVQVPESLTNVSSWKEVVRAISPKTGATTLGAFMRSENTGAGVTSENIKRLKDLLYYALSYAKYLFGESGSFEEAFEKELWDMQLIIGKKAGNELVLPFNTVINDIIARKQALAGKSTEAAEVYSRAITTVDNSMSSSFKSDNGYTLDNGLLSAICDNSAKYQKADELLNVIKNKVQLSGGAASGQPNGVADVLKFLKSVFESMPKILKNFIRLNYCSIDPSTGKININDVK